jgi:hypothetical protein
VTDFEDGDAPEGGRGFFVINKEQLVHVRIMLNELRDRREDNGRDTHDIDELLDDLPDFLIF